MALVGAVGLWAQPNVPNGGILNAASYMNPQLPGGAIAQGSIFVIFGSGMGPAALAQAGFPLPNTLAGTGVKVTSGGQTLDCPMIYTSAGQLAAVMPSTTPVGNATVTVTYNGATSVARSIRVASSAFGILTLNSKGTGPGVVVNYESASSQPVNTVLKSATPGQTLILYGTGLGALPAGSADNQAAPVAAINQSQVEVYVGVQKAAVAYAGRAPGFAGLDQINFVVPGGITGCAVPLAVKVGSVVSNFASIAVATNGGACSDPLGLTSTQLQRLSSGNTLRIGQLALLKTSIEVTLPVIGTQTISTEVGSGSFYELNPNNVIVSQSVTANGTASIGSCSVFVGTGTQVEPVDYAAPKGLDAGPSIAVTGPKGAKTMTKTQGTVGEYDATFVTGGFSIPGLPSTGSSDPYLVAGNYTFNNGAGGADVKGFNFNANFAAPVTWTNKDATVTVNRAGGVTVNWTGGDTNGFVEIYGYSSSDLTDNAVRGFFVCIERASAQTFTVPSVVLLSLPATPTGNASLGTVASVLGVGGISAPVSFTAAGIDVGTAISTTVTVKGVTYQ